MPEDLPGAPDPAVEALRVLLRIEQKLDEALRRIRSIELRK